MGKASFNRDTSTWILHDGEIIEGATLDANIAAKLVSTTGDLETIECNETQNALELTASGGMQWHVNMDGQYWWGDPNNQVWGTERTGGSGIWGIYKQSNIYTTARKYAGKNGLYGILIYREPNIGSGSTWGGISIYPPEEQCAKRGHRYRFSFDYRGYSNGNYLQVYQNYTVGWGSMGIGLPGAWGANLVAFDTDWEWRRFEYEFDIQDSLLDWVPGSNMPEWDANTTYTTGSWYAVTYNGYVYRHHPNYAAPTRGVTPEDEYGVAWDWRVPMTPGYMSIYNNIKIGFGYETQGTRGTHVYVDNIQLTDITDNKRWKYGANGWEADNISDAHMHVFAKGTALVTQDKGDGTDKFACEGSRVVRINGTDIGVPGGRGLVLSHINALSGDVISQNRYDTYGVDADRTALANALATMTDDDVWILTSYDAINPNTTLDNQMKAMGSVLLVNDGGMYSVYTGGGVRHPYAAVGRGQRLIKEDGSNANDTYYKRKGVIDIRI
jgi:hypothetical protein